MGGGARLRTMFDGTGAMDAKRLTVGVITGPHGVRGAVKVKSFTEDPLALFAYAPLCHGGTGEVLRLKRLGEAKGLSIVTIDGVRDRNAAEAMKGVEIQIDRSALPEPKTEGEDEDVFYHADLIGLPVFDRAGVEIGKVAALHDFGAGDVLDVAILGGGRHLLPFTREVVPVVDIAARRVVIDPPAEVEVPEQVETAEDEA